MSKDGTLADTLGEETMGLVVVDPDGHPFKYNQLEVYESIVARQSVRIEVDVPGEGARMETRRLFFRNGCPS